MKKKWLVLWGTLLCLMVGLTGCNRELTLEEIVEKMQAFDGKYDTMEGKAKVEVDGVITVDGVNIDLAMSVDAVMQEQKLESSSIIYMAGETTSEIMGETVTEEQETFVLTKDGLNKKYDCINGVWTYREEDESDNPGLFDDFYKEGSEWVLSEEHVDKNGIECYEIKVTISGETLEGFGGMFEMEGETADLSSSQMDAVLYVSVEDCSLREIYLDMSSVFANVTGMADDEAEIESEFKTCYMTLGDFVYNTELNLTVPEEALNAEKAKGILDQVKAAQLEDGTMGCAVSMEIIGEITVDGQTLDMELLMDVDYQMQQTKDSQKMHMIMDSNVSMMGQNQEVTTESYTVQDGNNVRVYTPVEGQWYYMDQPVEEVSSDMTGMIENVYNDSMSWTLKDENADLNGVTCYELTALLQGDAIQNVLQMTADIGLGNMGMDFTDSELQATLYISKDSYEIVGMYMNAKEIMESMFELMGVECSFETCAIAMKDVTYSTEEIIIPEEVLAAQEAVYEAPADETTGADEARLAEITKAGEYIMEMEGWPEKVRIEWPDGYECVYAMESDYLQFATYYNYVEYDFYNKELYEEYGMSEYMDEVISNYQLQADAYPELQVSDLQTMELEGGTCEYRKVSYMYEGVHPNTCYHALVKLGDNYVMVNTDFMSELDLQAHFEKIINGISLVK